MINAASGTAPNSASLALLACLVIATCLATAFPASAQKIISFDAPGADMTSDSFNGTFPVSINNFGAITGYYIDSNDVAYGFILGPGGRFTTFQAPGADTTTGSYNGTAPASINDLGVVAGEYWDANYVGHGFLRTPDGKFATFEVPGSGYGSVPQAINLEGAVVGYYSDPDYVNRAFLRKPDGTFKTLSGPGACNASPAAGCYGSGLTAINIFGTSAGGYEDNSGNFVHHDYVRTPDGKLTTFDAPGAGAGSYQGTGCPGCITGLNQWGSIAGIYTDANNVYHTFVRTPAGKFTTLDAPGAGAGSYQGTGCPSNCPVGLNDFGAITGIYIDANNISHGFLRSPAGKFTTVDASGSQGTYFVSINDLGEVTGYYLDANNVLHGFLRIP